jgi:uncharacterized membrane protein YeaQ/YmgE (transglycosylase-associated protein family)
MAGSCKTSCTLRDAFLVRGARRHRAGLLWAKLMIQFGVQFNTQRPCFIVCCIHLELNAFFWSPPSARRKQMVGVGWILAIILGAIAGWAAEKLMHANTGLLINIVLGIIGAVVGNFLLTLIFGVTAGGIVGQLLVAIVGACVLIAIGRAVTGGHRHTHA